MIQPATSHLSTLRDRADIVEIVSDAVLCSPNPGAIPVRAALHRHVPTVSFRLGCIQLDVTLEDALNVMNAVQRGAQQRPTSLPSLSPFFDAVCRAYLGALQLSFAHRVRG